MPQKSKGTLPTVKLPCPTCYRYKRDNWVTWAAAHQLCILYCEEAIKFRRHMQPPYQCWLGWDTDEEFDDENP